MRQVMVVLGIASAITVLTIGLIVIDAFRIAQHEAAAGNIDALGQFIFVGLLAVIAIRLLTLADP